MRFASKGISARLLVGLAAVAFILGGCGSGESNEPTATVGQDDSIGEASPTATIDPDRPAELGKVIWSAAVDNWTKAPTAQVDYFPIETPAIYAVYPVVYLPSATFLTATWSYNGTSLSSLTNEVLIAGVSMAGWVEFHLFKSSADPWPAGTYLVTVRTDDAELWTDEVEVKRVD